MLTFKVSISERNINFLSEFAAKNALSIEQISALVWLWSKNHPVTKDSINSIYDTMKRTFNSSVMGELIRNVESDNEFRKVDLGRFNRAVERILLNFNESSKSPADKLTKLSKGIGLDYEHGLLRFMQSGRKPGVSGMRQNFNLRQTFKASLFEQISRTDVDNSAIKKLSGKLLGEITGLQLLNSAYRQEAEGLNFFLQGWVNADGEIAPFLLKFKEGSSEKSGSGKNDCQILLFFNTHYLGEIMCRLTLMKEFLSCRFIVQEQDRKELIDRHIGYLEKQLEDLPWKVALNPTRVISDKEIQEIWFKETFKPCGGVYSGLDERV